MIRLKLRHRFCGAEVSCGRSVRLPYEQLLFVCLPVGSVLKVGDDGGVLVASGGIVSRADGDVDEKGDDEEAGRPDREDTQLTR